MKAINLLLASVTSLIALSSCAASSVLGVGGTELVVDLSQKKIMDREDPMFIVRMTPQLSGKCDNDLDGTERYIYWSGQCDFGGYKPDKVVIEYAKWKPYYQIPKPSKPHMIAFGDSLPASAWQTYTLYPKKIMAEVKQGQDPKYNPLLVPKAIARKSILVYLEINADGSVSISDNTQYGYTNNTDAVK
ncbi:hypothetical protein HQR03_08530 [Psychrobacter okhotskensis]|uniref:hypothetical protein n=1 Tax=Psychrobacter okhotskensis TaxID=212403 RepID=UPI0015677613|nr:hypothetical protein [Psychrobacter okhotskensis]NRD70579.1 hypothetical protein [Psychrobacter okhotskensis]